MKTNDDEKVREVLLSVEKYAKTCRDDFERGVFNQQTQVMGMIFNDLFIRLTMAYDRILAAHEREMAAKDAEIARLKAALKHILKAQMPSSGKFPYKTYSRKMRLHGLFDCDGGLIMATDGFGIASCVNAVLEAQRVMKEGGEE